MPALLSSALLLLQSSTLPSFDEVRLADCLKLAQDDPRSGLVNANEFARAKAGETNAYLADICLGASFAGDGKNIEALAACVAAAKGAQAVKDKRASRLWAEAGRIAIKAGQFSNAVRHLDTALSGNMAPKPRAETLIDRARALVAIGEVEKAGNDLSEVRRLTPDDGSAWLLSATLARRTGNLADAQSHIKTAALLSPSDAAVALEAGNIAAAAKAYPIAREQWQQTIRIAPKSVQAAAAQSLLEQLAEIEAADAKIPTTTSQPEGR